MKDVPIKQRREEFVRGMVPVPSSVVMKDVPTKFRREEFVRGMVPVSSSVVMKDVPTMVAIREESVGATDQGKEIYLIPTCTTEDLDSIGLNSKPPCIVFVTL